MEDQKLDTQEIIGKVKEYIEVRKELAFLSAVEKGSQLFANLITDGLVVFFGMLAILFGSFTLGFYLSELIGNSYAGFLIVTGFYLLLAIIIYSVKDRFIEKRIVNGMIKKVFTNRKVQ